MPFCTINVVFCHELDRARTIFSDVRNEAHNTARGHLEFFCPLFENSFVIRQQSPEVRVNRILFVLSCDERHRQGKWVCIACRAPLLLVSERPSIFCLSYATDLFAIKECD